MVREETPYQKHLFLTNNQQLTTNNHASNNQPTTNNYLQRFLKSATEDRAYSTASARFKPHIFLK